MPRSHTPLHEAYEVRREDPSLFLLVGGRRRELIMGDQRSLEEEFTEAGHCNRIVLAIDQSGVVARTHQR